MANEKVEKIVNRYRKIMIDECKPLYKEMLDLSDEDFVEAWVEFSKIISELKDWDEFYAILKRLADLESKDLINALEEIDTTFDDIGQRYVDELEEYTDD